MRLILLSISLLFSSTVFSQSKQEKLDSFLKQLNVSWKKHNTDHFTFYVERDCFADNHIEQIQYDFELIRNQIIYFLGDSNFIDTASIIIVDTKEKIKSILGFEAQGFAIPESDIAIFLNSKNYPIATKHELTHYYAFKIWGRPYDNWLSEGLAVYYDNRWNGHPIDSLSKHLKDNKKLYSISSLIKSFYSLNPMIAYPEIGSFTSFLLSEYGSLNFKELWLKGFNKIQLIYKKKLKELENEWLKYLDRFKNENIDYSRHVR